METLAGWEPTTGGYAGVGISTENHQGTHEGRVSRRHFSDAEFGFRGIHGKSGILGADTTPLRQAQRETYQQQNAETRRSGKRFQI